MLKTNIKSIINISSGVVLVISSSALIGWFIGTDILKGISNEYVPMAPNTALLFIIISISILLLSLKPSLINHVVRVGAGIVTLISFIYLVEYSGVLSFNIDFWFFKFGEDKIAGVPVGKMSFYTALAFFLSAISSLFITIRSRYESFENVSMVSSIVVISLALFFLFGYLFGKSSIYVGSFIPMAINTAISFLFIGGSTLLLTLSKDVSRSKSLKEFNKLVPIYKKIWGGFGLGFAAIIIISTMSFYNSLSFINTTKRIEQKQNVLTEIEVLTSVIKDVALQTSRFVATGDDFFIELHLSSVEELYSKLDTLRSLTRKDSVIGKYIDRLEILLDQRLQLDEELIALKKAENQQEVQEIIISGKGEDFLDSISSVVEKVGNYERSELKNLYRTKGTNFNETLANFSILILVILIIFSILYFIIKKELFARQRIQEETKQLNIKLEAVNKELESFTYTVSHDLRAPVRHINGFLEILESNIIDKLDEKNLRYFNLIKGSTKEMSDLIGDLLSFSRTAKTELNKTKINLDQIVQEVIQNIQQDPESKNVRWITNDLPEVYVDYPLIKVVLINLISNAVKFTSKVANPVVTISSQKYDNKRVISIKDNGVGFDMNYYSKLFGVFQRLHTIEDFPGTGIGLATVKKIIKKHGGNVWAESKEGEGATFFFSLPLY